MFNTLTRFFPTILPRGVFGISSRSKQNSLLRILSVSHSQRLDPKTLIGNLAAEYPGWYGRKLMSLQRWVAADSSMSAALTHTPGVLDEDDALAIQCGIETNTLDETFDSLLAGGEKDDQTATSDIVRGTLAYVIGVFCFATLVATFIMFLIVPTISQIFEEFALELPALMSALIALSKSIAIFIPILFLAALGFAFLLLFDDVRRGIRRSPLGRLIPTAARRQSAALLRLLALPTGMGRPVGPTLTAAAQFHPDHRCRKRLLLARTDAQSDADVWLQLARQGLISKTQGEQLGKIDSPSLRAWTLTTLADRNRRRANQQTEFLARVTQHIPIIILGIFVGWIAIAVMQTLTGLVSSLA